MSAIKTFAVLAVALFVQTAVADDYKYLNVTRTTGGSSVELSTVKKISFSGGNAIISTTTGDITYPLSEMQKIQFSSTALSIGSLPGESQSLHYTSGVLTAGKKGLLRVYGASGALIRVAKVTENSKVNLNSLPKGLYIISLGEQTIKITK